MAPEFWDDPAISEAFAHRHIGQVIRAWRTHRAHGRRPIPQEQVAEWACVTQPQLSRIETGPPMKDLDRLIYWAELLHLPPDRLWFALPDRPGRPGALPSQAPGADKFSLPVLTPTGETIILNVSRRDLLCGLGAIVAASLPQTRTQRSLLPLGADPDLLPVEHFHNVLTALNDSDNLFGASQVLPAVYEQLRLLDDLRQSVTGADRHAVVRLQTAFAELGAWLHQDLGNHDNARDCADRALEWSLLSGDDTLTTLVLVRKAHLAGETSDAGKAVECADAASNLAPPGARMAVAARAYAGHGHALAGDRHASEQAYDQAFTLLTGTDDDSRWGWWGGWLDEPYLTAQNAGSLLALNDHEGAATEYDRAIADLPADYPRDRAVYQARAARARTGTGDLDHAISLGTEALMTTARSGRIDCELRLLLDELNDSAAPAIDEFRDLARSAGLISRTTA